MKMISEMKKRLNRKGQEEMVGFALIVIIVAVILLVFLGFSLRNSQKESIESYEAESFLSATLQYTTDCRSNLEYLSIQKLIFECYRGSECFDDRDSCDVLNSTLEGILEESWDTGEESPVKGYELNITSGSGEIIFIKKGEITSNSKGSSQELVRGGNTLGIIFIAYY
jgi:hypothetical protein